MNEVTPKKRKDFSLVLLQVVCAICVVTMHTNTCYWDFNPTESYWITANILGCVCYFAVPIFFMITGITLLDFQDRYSTKIYFIKRIEKTLIPYISWSLIGVLWLVITKSISIGDISLKWLVNGLLSTKGIVEYYWFFQPLFCVYLCIPVFALIDKEKKQSISKFILILAFFINVLIPFLNSLFNLGIEWPYSIAVGSGYLFWIWGGYYFYNNSFSKKVKICILTAAVAGLLMSIIGTHVLSVKAGSIQSILTGYINLPCVLYSCGAFIFLREVAIHIEKINWIRTLIEFLGEYTFPLYLMHWFIIKLIIEILPFNTKSLIYRLFIPYVIFAIVIGITWCLRKIPLLQKIVP